MPITLTAVQCPPIQVPAGVYDVTSGGITSKNLAIGDTAALRTKFNENAGRADLVARYGGGVYGVCTGLALSAGSGLNASVAAGVAMIDGIVEFTSTQTVPVTASGRNHIWLRRTGALTSVFTSLTPPGTDYCYIGSVVTSGSAVTSVDESGILYLLGSMPKRQTADTTTPADTPSAAIQFLNYGVGKVWLWSGTQYWQIAATVGGMPLAQLVKSVSASFTFTAAELLAAGNIELNNGGIGAAFTATWPSAGLTAGQYWVVTNNTGQNAIVKVLAGSDTYLSAGARRHFLYDGSELRRVHNPQLASQSISGASSPNWEAIEAERQEYAISGGSQVVTWPTSLPNKSRIHSIRNDNSGTNALTVAASGAAAVHTSLLLPGEETLTVIGNDGIIRPAITRPRTHRVSITHDDAATYTVIHPDFLGVVLEVAGTLTAARNLALPTVDHKVWFVRNQTAGGFSLTVKTAAGTGVQLRPGKGEWLRCDGTNIVPAHSRAMIASSSEEIAATTTSTVTVANTTTQTSLIGTTIGTVTLPAALLTPGRTVRLVAWGFLSSTGNPNLTIVVKLGSTTVLTTGAVAQVGTPTDQLWRLEAELTCRTIGASGTVFAQGLFLYGANFMPLVTTATVTIDTTAAQLLDTMATWGTAAAGNTLSCSNSRVEILN